MLAYLRWIFQLLAVNLENKSTPKSPIVYLDILKNHNSYVFASSNNCVQDLVDTGITWAMSYLSRNSRGPQPFTLILLKYWSPPKPGWIKMKSDGAVSFNDDNASIGGVFKDADGNWLCSYLL
ncbi:hypothetical protein PVK06_007857 [Gossypium arboreum]|uniref:Uncharacterized protein n=1 Tax=Gossypium arboreum TaxID=29729 RepID=A0ABR0QIE3_GOSAR|nr:hypothetical protein PVK06_007857 [Gossypium arboreum]